MKRPRHEETAVPAPSTDRAPAWHCLSTAEVAGQALERPRARLDEHRVPYSYHLLVGPPWQMISEYAKEKACDQIVMGRRGLGSFTGGLFGSVAQKVLQLAEQPVLLVK